MPYALIAEQNIDLPASCVNLLQKNILNRRTVVYRSVHGRFESRIYDAKPTTVGRMIIFKLLIKNAAVIAFVTWIYIQAALTIMTDHLAGCGRFSVTGRDPAFEDTLYFRSWKKPSIYQFHASVCSKNTSNCRTIDYESTRTVLFYHFHFHS